jgi:hypothetical protein
MGADQNQDGRTVQLNMAALHSEAVELAGEEEAGRLWKENRLDSEDNWPGKWATAMEVVQKLRDTKSEE